MSDQSKVDILISKIEKLDDRVYDLSQIKPVIEDIKEDIKQLRKENKEDKKIQSELKNDVDELKIESQSKNKINKWGQVLISLVLMPVFTIVLKMLKII